jgi:hypothetical protein
MPSVETQDRWRAGLDWLLNTTTGRLSLLAFALLYLLVWWRILSRAGFPGGLALLMFMPLVNVGLWVFLAFAPWPARRELRALRKVQRVVQGAERRRLAG